MDPSVRNGPPLFALAMCALWVGLKGAVWCGAMRWGGVGWGVWVRRRGCTGDDARVQGQLGTCLSLTMRV